MMININIDSDDEGKIQLAVQGHIIPDWVYANSQTEHENKRIRQHQQLLEREAKQELQQKRRRLQRLEKQNSINTKTKAIAPQHVNRKELTDDGPDL